MGDPHGAGDGGAKPCLATQPDVVHLDAGLPDRSHSRTAVPSASCLEHQVYWLQLVGLVSRGIAQERAAQGAWRFPPETLQRGPVLCLVWDAGCLKHPSCGDTASAVILEYLRRAAMLSGQPSLLGKGLLPFAPSYSGRFSYQRYRLCHRASPMHLWDSGAAEGDRAVESTDVLSAFHLRTGGKLLGVFFLSFHVRRGCLTAAGLKVLSFFSKR